MMLQRFSKFAFIVLATIACSGLAQAQFGGVQLQIGGYGSGIRAGSYGYGNGLYGGNAFGNSYFGSPYYGNSYYGNRYSGNLYNGNRYYGNSGRYGSYSNRYYNNGFGTSTLRNYGVRTIAPRYATPYRSTTIRRYRSL